MTSQGHMRSRGLQWRSAAAGREALHSLATQRRLHEVCRVLDEWELPERPVG